MSYGQLMSFSAPRVIPKASFPKEVFWFWGKLMRKQNIEFAFSGNLKVNVWQVFSSL